MAAVAGGCVDVGVEAERLTAIPELEKLGNQVTETAALGVKRGDGQPADKEGGDEARD